MTHNYEKLKAHILPLSTARTFELAKREWVLVGVEVSTEFDQCPCGHDIKEHCYIRNTTNNNETYVGNVCIKRFIGIDTGALFAGLKRIAKDDTANPNADVIAYAQRFGYIYEKEYTFLMETRRRRHLSPKQLEWKKKINRRIVNKTVVVRRTGSSPSGHIIDEEDLT